MCQSCGTRKMMSIYYDNETIYRFCIWKTAMFLGVENICLISCAGQCSNFPKVYARNENTDVLIAAVNLLILVHNVEK